MHFYYKSPIKANEKSVYKERSITKDALFTKKPIFLDAFANDDNKEFSLYSFTTNNELPQRNPPIKSHLETPHFSTTFENITKNEHFKISLKEKIKTVRETLETEKRRNKELSSELDHLKTQIREEKNENDSENLANKAKFLQEDIEKWRKKLQETEKQNSHEIAKIKLMFQNSFISSDSEIPTEKENRENENTQQTLISQVKEKIDSMNEKNRQLNQILNRLIDELSFIKIENRREYEECLNRILKKIQSENLELQKNLSKKLDNLNKEIRENKIDNETNDFIVNNSHNTCDKKKDLDEVTKKKLNVLEIKNKELEDTLENIKLQYWNLEKKMQYESLMGEDVKFTEEYIENLAFNTQKENLEKEEQLKIKVKNLLLQKQSLQKQQIKKK